MSDDVGEAGGPEGNDPEVDGFYGIDRECGSPDTMITGKDGKPQKPAAPVAGCEPDDSSLEPKGFHSSWEKVEKPDHCKVLGFNLGPGCGDGGIPQDEGDSG